ncbi:MAG TPA: hypothetical protein VMD56_08710 [Steroidobacteraceae bacterium]|nr:hypothetical protein [Steroidobacteraceae bacterium]
MLMPHSLAASLGLAAAVAGLAALPFAALAATPGSPFLSSEIQAAQTYGTVAAQANSVAEAHRLLYSVLDCLDGPKGKWYYPKQNNPCLGTGHGAIHDATSPRQMKMLERLATQAHAGLMSMHLATVRHDATTVAADLKKMV